MSLDDKLKQIDDRLNEIDSEIGRLTVLKRKLTAAKEKLQDKKFLETRQELAKNDWNNESFPWSITARDRLKSVFTANDFRSKQLETINVTMSKIDVLLVASTGAGKSLCFQLPAVCDAGVTLVISPLVSLMEDQLYMLKKRGVPAEVLSMATDHDTVQRIHKCLNEPGYSLQLKLLYVTPERMAKSKRFMSALQKCYQNNKLERIAIDEVHCCSTMGHDFRPDFKYLSTLKTLFPKTPIIGVTATASRKVLMDVQKILNIRGCIIFNAPFNRPNLFYGCLEKPSDNEQLYDLLADLLRTRYEGQSGIIYTFSIKDTETLVSELLQRECKVRSYHASLESNQRSKVYQQWMKNEIQAVVATIAFGMGIDKPDVRFVIHHTMSKSMENYYQESGRAGRDGKYAECILLYRFSDLFKISTMTFVESNGLRNTYSMVDYCVSAKKCRRDLFSNYFTEVWNDRSCGKMCDHCYYNSSSRTVAAPTMDILVHYRTLLKIIDKAISADNKLTALKLIEAWFHKGPNKTRIDIPPPSIERFYGEQIIAFLIMNDYLKEDFHYTAYSTISYIQKGSRSITGEEIEFQPARNYDLPPIDEMKEYLTAMSADVKPFVDNKLAPQASTLGKKRHLSISSSSDEGPSNNKLSMSTSDIEKLIDRKVDMKLRRILEPSTSALQQPDVIAITPKKEETEVIEID